MANNERTKTVNKYLLWKTESESGIVHLDDFVGHQNILEGRLREQGVVIILTEKQLVDIVFDGVVTIQNIVMDDDARKTWIKDALDDTDWKQGKAAELVGVSPRVFNYWCKKFNITCDGWKGRNSRAKLRKVG